MSDTSQTVRDIVGLALSITTLTTTWPIARRIFSKWTRLQRFKFVASMLVCIAFCLAPIPLLDLLVPRNSAGRAPLGAAVGAEVATLGWIFLGILLLLRYLMDEPQPKWVAHFGVTYILALFIVAAGVGIVLAVRFG